MDHIQMAGEQSPNRDMAWHPAGTPIAEAYRYFFGSDNGAFQGVYGGVLIYEVDSLND